MNLQDECPELPDLKKIPAVFFFSGENADLHMPTDDAEKIDYDFF
jgi:hypothetical protein